MRRIYWLLLRQLTLLLRKSCKPMISETNNKRSTDGALAILESRLGYQFKDRNLLTQALTHRSAPKSSEDRRRIPSILSNERLEFLGDSVLSLAITSRLYHHQDPMPEGVLSKIRASLVNESNLAATARMLDLGGCIFLGRAEENSGGRDRDSILADSLEAVIGAVYLDSDLSHASQVVDRILGWRLENSLDELIAPDYKTTLQERTQKWVRMTPAYHIVSHRGPDHQREYCVAVVISDFELGRGWGLTKKSASQDSARLALDIIPTKEHLEQWLTDHGKSYHA
jgi:ribonuclease III